MKNKGEHFEVYCLPDNLKPRTFLDFKEALQVYDAHSLDCKNKRSAQLVRVTHGPDSWRDVMLP